MPHPELPPEFELVPCAVGPDGWLYVPHADGKWVTAAKLQPFSLAIIGAWLEEQPAPPHVTDTQMLDFIASEYLDVLAFDMPTGAGDADVGWKLIQHHEGKQGAVEVGITYHDDVRAAIRTAMQGVAARASAADGVPATYGTIAERAEAGKDAGLWTDGVQVQDGWSRDRPNSDGRWLWREGDHEHREVALILCDDGAEVDEAGDATEGTPQYYWEQTPTDQRSMPGLWKRADGVPEVPHG